MSYERSAPFVGEFFRIEPGNSDRTWTVSVAIEPSDAGRFLTEVGTPPHPTKYEANRAAAPAVLVVACPRRRGAALSEDFVADTLAGALLARLDRQPARRSDQLSALFACLRERFA